MCCKLPSLIDIILLQTRQGHKNSVLIKINVDSGGGFLKLCLSTFDINDPCSKSNSELSKKIPWVRCKKSLHNRPGTRCLRTFVNVKQMWINCGVNILKNYTIVTDLKLCNVLLGMMSHSPCYPCAWCDTTKDNLHKKGKKGTISNLMKLFWNFFESRSEKKEAKNFGNVIYSPILCDDESKYTPIIFLLPPPELRLLIGPVNKMYNALETIWPDSEEWLKSCNVRWISWLKFCW